MKKLPRWQQRESVKTAMQNLLELRSVSKSFGNVKALRGLDFSLEQGEIVALLGDNGAGKSTLIKILSGLYSPDSGSFTFMGKAVPTRQHNVAHIRKLGIETVYQDRALGEKQPLWRNLFVGRHLLNRFGLIDKKREYAAALKIIEDFGFSGAGIAPDTPAGLLSGGEKQGLAIGRAMYFDAKVVILDEPTTALSLGEVDKVLNFIKTVRARGNSAIIITHSLDHAWEVADRFVIMSRGKIFGQWNKAELCLETLTAKMREACL